MVFSVTSLLIVGLAAHNVFANPLPETASLASRATCIHPKGPIPIGSECFKSGMYAGKCITFECLEHPNACGCPGAPPESEKQERSVPVSEDCPLTEGCGPIVVPPTTPERSVPRSEDCPYTKGCGPIVVPPTAPVAAERSLLSTRSCTEWKGPIPIGSECFTTGPHKGQCIPFYCLQKPNTCGCPGAGA